MGRGRFPAFIQAFELPTPAMSRLLKPFEEELHHHIGGDRGFKSPTALNWQQFHDFLLQRMTAKTAEDRLRYSKQYGHVLRSNNNNSIPADLLQFSPNKRIHIMKALSSLAQFTGQVEQWLAIRQRYNLTWSTGTEKIDAFTRFFNDEVTLDTLIQWLIEALHQLPAHFANVFLFCSLTGMRATECLASIKLIKEIENVERYYDSKNHVLRHYLFADTFIRRTKALYISIIDDEILEIARKIDKIPTLNTLKTASRRRNLRMKLKYCRKIHASYLRQKGGLEAEIVDLLQGRVPKSVFTRHYLTPSQDWKYRVLSSVKKLQEQIVVES